MESALTVSRLTVFSLGILWTINIDAVCRKLSQEKKNYIIKLLNEQNNKCGLAVETDRYCFMSMTKPLGTTEAKLKLINLIIQKKNCKPRLPSWSFSTTPQEGALRGSWELRATSSFRDKSARSSDRMR